MTSQRQHLKTVEQLLLWHSHWMIHHANHIRPKADGIKVGGHQASSASIVSIMTALYFSTLRPEDRVAVKPHASPIFHAAQYLFGNQTREKMENFRGYGGVQSYPSRTKDIDDVDFSTGSVGLGVAITSFASIIQDYIAAKDWGAGAPMGRMVASLAHQIRTPLSAAMLYASNLKNPRVSQPVREQFVDKLLGRLHHLEQQVQDMLVFVKGECKLIHRVTVADLYSAMQDNLSVLIQQHPDALEWRDLSNGAELQCQKDALVSALSNLVTNAFEAIRSNPSISIIAREESGRLLLTIADNGPGMDEATLNQVTEPFFTTKSHGTGLGLPVVMAVTRAHQGEFHINSRPGEGTQVALSFPVKG